MPTEVLPRTFVHVPGVGLATERSFWRNGILSWHEFLKSSERALARLRFRDKIPYFLEQSLNALSRGDAAFFSTHLPRREWWRLYSHFHSKTVFLDIETTGLSPYYDEVTLVGLYDGAKCKTFLAGHNLHQLSDALAPYDIVVTFNGTLFDLPFLKTKLPSLRLPPVHLDLRWLLKRIGHTGGLKEIELKFGMRRAKEIRATNGLMATVLWARYVRGDIDALAQLVRYNTADITSLYILMKYCTNQLALRLFEDHKVPTSLPRLSTPKRVFVHVQRINGSRLRLAVDQDQILVKPPCNDRPLITVQHLLSKLSSKTTPRIVGIDLRGSEVRASGWALLTGGRAETKMLKTDDQIIEETIKHTPDVISIDSPLGLPIGRCCGDDSCHCRTKGILRECERTLWKRGVRVFPCLLPSMQCLTLRGIRLAKVFRRRGFEVIESYPGAAQDIMRIPRKKSSLEDLSKGLAAFGITGPFISQPTNHDELDAITSAVVGYFYLTGDYEALGNKQEEHLIIPRLDQLLKTKPSKETECLSLS
ncbi:MAG: ribonuclease H-like domain-containing protein [Nitrospiraceae bacterium]